VGLELHEEVVGRGPAVDLERLERGADVGAHGAEEVGDLQGDALERGAGDVRAGGAARDAGDQAAGVRAPVGGAEAGVGGDEDDAAAVGDAGGEGLDLAGGGDEVTNTSHVSPRSRLISSSPCRAAANT